MGHPDSRALRERRVMTAGALVVVGAVMALGLRKRP